MQRDMTSGKPMRVILGYALPLFAGNLLQQTYNVVDAAVVGRFVGKDALAAVGSSFSIVHLANSIIIGLCMGAGVLVSRYYGAKDIQKLQATISTSFLFVMSATLLLAVLAQTILRPLLSVFQMPSEVRPNAEIYLRIMFCGMFFSCLYNSVAFLLRAVGDSKSPLIFLSVSMVLNVGLDLLFVPGFGWGVPGAAVATVVAQAFSAVFAAVYAARKLDFLRMSWKPKADRALLSQIARFGALTSLQQSVMNLGGLLVQGLVNTFGVAVMAAFTACGKIDSFIHLPMPDFGSALMTYIAQNAGAKKADRIRSGLRFSVSAALGYCAVVSVFVLLFSKLLLTIFIDPGEAEVLAVGMRYLSVVACFYPLIGILNLFYGYYRGIGKPHLSLVLSGVSLGTRVVAAYALASAFGYVDAIWWGIPLGWALADITGVIMYRKTKYILTPITSLDQTADA